MLYWLSLFFGWPVFVIKLQPAVHGVTVTITYSHFQKNIAKRQDYDGVISGGSLILPSPDWHQQLSECQTQSSLQQICFLLSNSVLLPTHNSSRTISSTYKNLQLLNLSGNK